VIGNTLLDSVLGVAIVCSFRSVRGPLSSALIISKYRQMSIGQATHPAM
jgi:hypothetical protein